MTSRSIEEETPPRARAAHSRAVRKKATVRGTPGGGRPSSQAERGLRLMPKQRLNVPAAAQHAKNEHIFVLDAVDDDVLADGKDFAVRGASPRRALGLCWDGSREERTGR